MTTERRQIDIEGLAFRLIVSPRPAASTTPTIVLVHGIGMSHRYLARLHRVLARSARVVSIDLPGFGGLPKPGYDPDVPRMGRALAEVISTLGDARVVLVGHSMGAQWVVEAAAQLPGVVAAVVAIGPVVDQENRTLSAQVRALAMDTLGETPRINAIVFSDYVRCGPRWYLTQVRHMLAYPIEQRVRALEVPLLVIRGEKDPVAGRDWCRRLTAAAWSARLVHVPRRHHVVQESAPLAVADAILSHTASAHPGSAPEPVMTSTTLGTP
ncbi:alpha/beta hydrolase [Microbacterium sp.]|uniref:alpha/beta fold hydrolase n=1 Tax=Microbacterium sp. TaxID=51671 RepID=UPI0028119A27|nr:alpha/beta hydrolase [Microbacterium sp.]